jgi:hypothetical protein
LHERTPNFSVGTVCCWAYCTFRSWTVPGFMIRSCTMASKLAPYLIANLLLWWSRRKPFMRRPSNFSKVAYSFYAKQYMKQILLYAPIPADAAFNRILICEFPRSFPHPLGLKKRVPLTIFDVNVAAIAADLEGGARRELSRCDFVKSGALAAGCING